MCDDKNTIVAVIMSSPGLQPSMIYFYKNLRSAIRGEWWPLYFGETNIRDAGIRSNVKTLDATTKIEESENLSSYLRPNNGG